MFEAANLFCERDERVLFRNLSFAVESGRILQVQGANGSGKTTLLRILCGLNQDFEGALFWYGRPLHEVRAEFLGSTFYLGHAPAINKTLTPAENLRWFCATRGDADPRRIPESLNAFNLYGYDDMPCYLMSAGQQRRVSLARLYLSDAALWILDEPFTALDREGVEDLENFLDERVQAGGSVILTTHHALQVSREVTVINLDNLARQEQEAG